MSDPITEAKFRRRTVTWGVGGHNTDAAESLEVVAVEYGIGMFAMQACVST